MEFLAAAQAVPHGELVPFTGGAAAAAADSGCPTQQPEVACPTGPAPDAAFVEFAERAAAGALTPHEARLFATATHAAEAMAAALPDAPFEARAQAAAEYAGLCVSHQLLGLPPPASIQQLLQQLPAPAPATPPTRPLRRPLQRAQPPPRPGMDRDDAVAAVLLLGLKRKRPEPAAEDAPPAVSAAAPDAADDLAVPAAADDLAVPAAADDLAVPAAAAAAAVAPQPRPGATWPLCSEIVSLVSRRHLEECGSHMPEPIIWVDAVRFGSHAYARAALGMLLSGWTFLPTTVPFAAAAAFGGVALLEDQRTAFYQLHVDVAVFTAYITTVNGSLEPITVTGCGLTEAHAREAAACRIGLALEGVGATHACAAARARRGIVAAPRLC
ncbi:hypothetical protein Rsub_04399 [Raphidocelis subcapitata]|uniref:Uncharacterized protein n=1 Tax=Raphidocelis subcapitata TaxID=307507 RepID=A0A2V0NZF1_9CHLO|nr:hypothetical protein Rsub_04399 [Raphidocelis subcapitata]|eukprot:GBF92052.1 hypothetical protein Rsub_04399 [Raphidocelis subcapitata]